MLPVRLARRTNPFRAFDDLFDGLDRWAGARMPESTFAARSFLVDIREDENGFIIEAEVPGFSRDDIDITVEQNVLTITAERKSDSEHSERGYHLRERREGRLERSFQLPSTADGDKVDAELKNGVLTLRVPTKAEARPRKITVQ